jgi:hypothetical protein
MALLRENAIVVPSGDHAGEPAKAESSVTGVSFAAATSST